MIKRQQVNAIAPGWYKDPADPTTQRYWDGEGWLGDAMPATTPRRRRHQPSPDRRRPRRGAGAADGRAPPLRPGTAGPPGRLPTGPAAAGRDRAAARHAAAARPQAQGPCRPACRPGWPAGYPSAGPRCPDRARRPCRTGWPRRPRCAAGRPARSTSPRCCCSAWRPTAGSSTSSGARCGRDARGRPAVAGATESTSADVQPEPAGTLLIVIVLVAAALWFAYEVPAIANTGQTLGKRLLGIKVVRLESERAPRLRPVVPPVEPARPADPAVALLRRRLPPAVHRLPLRR